MAEINVQRRQSSVWIWVLAIVGGMALLWALIGGPEREPDMLPSAPGVSQIGDPRDLVIADDMSSLPTRHREGDAPRRG